jgi:hypothetical protein
MNVQTDIRPGQATWDAVKRYLEERRRPVEEEIRRYPPPIAGCDAHFNYLLEQRATLSRELVRLEAARRAANMAEGPAVEAFLQSSACIGADIAARIRAG